jgi:hypothetical protein
MRLGPLEGCGDPGMTTLDARLRRSDFQITARAKRDECVMRAARMAPTIFRSDASHCLKASTCSIQIARKPNQMVKQRREWGRNGKLVWPFCTRDEGQRSEAPQQTGSKRSSA